MKIQIKKAISLLTLLTLVFGYQSCSDLEKYEPLGENSIADETPPSANFSYSQGAGTEEGVWKIYSFANASSSATTYEWNFGDGNTSTEIDPENTYPGEGTYTVTLTASDDLGVSSTYSETIEVIEPEEPDVPDPAIVNPDFDKLPKSSGSDCACSGWINRGLGEQGESSTADGADVLKLDNAEPDHAYQEFAVVPNAEYQIQISVRHSSLVGAEMLPSSLEIRVLAGNGYVDGYSPVYYTDTAEMPQGNDDTGLWGYQSVAQMEDENNNLFVQVIDNPGDDSYITYTSNFNVGANDSVALFIRGIGNADPEDPNDFAMYGYASGEEEIRIAYLAVTAINN